MGSTLGLQILFFNLAIFFLILFSSSSFAQTNCIINHECGNVSVPFPFGTTKDCSLTDDFLITCNRTFTPPKAFLQKTTIEVTNISLDGQLRVLQYIAQHCYDINQNSVSEYGAWIRLPKIFTVSNTANKFTVIGCDTYGYVSGDWLKRTYQTGCSPMCMSKDDLVEGSCTGVGCCQLSIPKHVSSVQLEVSSFSNYSGVLEFNDCSYAFVVEESAFSFSPENLTNLKNVEGLPVVVDWAVGNGTCEEARNSSSYACKSVDSDCYKPDNGVGYRCSCRPGYHGNPYLDGGCKDIDECKDSRLNDCEKKCKNTLGSFYCVCPKGYHGDGRRSGGRGCVRDESLVFKLVAGIALGIIGLLVPVCWFHMRVKRRKLIKTRQKFFLQNGGPLLHEKLARKDGSSSLRARIFSASELHKATNNFDNNVIVGRGGFGTVYKGVLSDDEIVAIKKSREVVDPRQIEQFINEVIVLSQINHRNVVKLLGCCLETQAPLLVYEFISNGTLYEHLHDEGKARVLSWDTRLRIAAETAGVLSYLHSAASTPIIHRDVKSANILLDRNHTAKVADFGASRLVPLEQTQLSTLVQGTFGYLDPEYMQSNQLSEKSDVYSFGVVLVELLTGRKAVSNDRPEEERSLANFFLYVMKRDRLFDVLEHGIVREGNKEQVMEVATLATKCLNVKGDERPSMKEVAMVLEGLRVGEEQSFEHIEEDVSFEHIEEDVSFEHIEEDVASLIMVRVMS